MIEESKTEISLDLLVELLAAHADVMSGLSSGLAALVSDREEEFLGLGSNLMEFTSRSQSLAQSASALTELCSGEEVAANATSLSDELANLSAVYNPDDARAGLHALEHVMGLVSHLDGQVAEFGRIIKSLTMLGISTRIESARLGDQGLGFSTLADDVETLAHKIVQDSSAIAGKSSSLDALLGSVRHRTRALSQEQDECSSGILSDIDSSLTAMNEMMERSRMGASHIAQRSEIVAANVAEVVSSLQFHDIVRQQVEHVEEALDEMLLQTRTTLGRFAPSEDDLGGGGSVGAGVESKDGDHVDEDIGASDVSSFDSEAADARVSDEDGTQAMSSGQENDLKGVVGWVADVSELQVSQLDNASQRFAAAVGGLRDGLSGISAAAGEIGTDVSDVLSAGDSRDGGTVMDRVGESTQAVLKAMEVFSDKSAEIAALIGSVTGTVSEMTEFVSNIEEVGSEIELIALNASIKAAHTGEEGKALGVLAQAIQRLSVDARDRTQAVSQVLLEISKASSELERASDTTEKKSLIDQYAERQRELMTALMGLSGRLSGAASDVLSLSSSLGGDMDALVSSIRLDEEICPGLDNARNALRNVVDDSRRLVPVSDDEGRPARLKEMLSRYTMEAERLVHESAFGVENVGPVLNHEDEGEVELFDDVELFDEQGDEEPAGEDWDNIELF